VTDHGITQHMLVSFFHRCASMQNYSCTQRRSMMQNRNAWARFYRLLSLATSIFPQCILYQLGRRLDALGGVPHLIKVNISHNARSRLPSECEPTRGRLSLAMAITFLGPNWRSPPSSYCSKPARGMRVSPFGVEAFHVLWA
jgi:hypothetical protein